MNLPDKAHHHRVTFDQHEDQGRRVFPLHRKGCEATDTRGSRENCLVDPEGHARWENAVHLKCPHPLTRNIESRIGAHWVKPWESLSFPV